MSEKTEKTEKIEKTEKAAKVEQPAEIQPIGVKKKAAERSSNGRVISVQGPIVDVKFESTELLPSVFEVIHAETYAGKKIMLQVAEHHPGAVARCISLHETMNLQRNSIAVTKYERVKVPVGEANYGRIINAMGESIDNKGEVIGEQYWNIRRDKIAYKVSTQGSGNVAEIMETGIKIIDLFTPLVKGSKIGVLGGAACGKTVVILELMNNVVSKHSGACVFTGIGERIREGNDLFYELKEHNLLPKVMMAFGQMDQPPGARMEVIMAGITLAEFIQSQNKDVLFFGDNVFRYVQGGQEVSTLLGRIPSETGYQPTLASEVAEFQERIRSAEGGGSITSFQAVYVPADDFTDPAVVAIYSYLDGVMSLSRDMLQKGLYPAIDPLKSSCVNLDTSIVGRRHYDVAQQALNIFTKLRELKKIVAVIGVEELSPSDKTTYERGLKLQNYLTQPFTVAEVYTGRKGAYVKPDQTVRDCESIIMGEHDDKEYRDFYMISTIAEKFGKGAA